MSTTRSADAYGIHHRTDCTHSERVARASSGGWRCNGCGMQSPSTNTRGITNESD